MFRFSGFFWTFVFAILLLFGGKRIPELARNFGRASYEFKKAKETIAKEASEMKKELENISENTNE